MEIRNYSNYGIRHPSHTQRVIEIDLKEHLHYVKITLVCIRLDSEKTMGIISETSTGINEIEIVDMKLTDLILEENYYAVDIAILGNRVNQSFMTPYVIATKIAFIDCHFSNIKSRNQISDEGLFLFRVYTLNNKIKIFVSFLRSTFHGISSTTMFKEENIGHLFPTVEIMDAIFMNIKNSSFSNITISQGLVWLKGTALKLHGPVTLTNIVSYFMIHVDTIILTNQVTISFSRATACIMTNLIFMEEYTKLKIIANNFSVAFYTENEPDKYLINDVFCLFQYIKGQTTYVDPPFENKYSVVLQGNKGDLLYNKRFATSHCLWTRNSVFKNADPHKINEKVIRTSYQQLFSTHAEHS